MIVRHAKAEAFAEEDHGRALTSRGRRDSRAAGEWLASRDYVPTHALVSSAARTRATWELVSEASGSPASARVEDGFYSGGVDSVIDSLRTVPQDAGVVAFVGHNPTAASLAFLLDDGDPDEDAFRRMSEGFATAAMAVLEVAVPWTDLDAAEARLVDFHVGQG